MADQPEIVREAKFGIWPIVRLGVIAAVAGWFAFTRHDAVGRYLFGWVPLTIYALLVAFLIYRRARPAELRLSKTHLTRHNPLLPDLVLTWAETEPFEVRPRRVAPRSLQDKNYVRYGFTTRSAASSVLDRAMRQDETSTLRRRSRRDDGLGGPWEISSEDLAKKLNAYRDRALANTSPEVN